MKEEDVTPGTIYPLVGKLLCFLPERLKKKLCCVTPLGQTVSETPSDRMITAVKLNTIFTVMQVIMLRYFLYYFVK